MSGSSAELQAVVGGGYNRVLGALSISRPRTMPARADLVGATLAMLGSVLAAGFSLQLWKAHLHVPLVYGSDQLITEMAVKQVLGGGWVWTYHALGAPFGLQLYDFPIATDDLNFLAMRIIGLVTSDPAKVINIFFLLTFPAAALSGYVVLRWLGISAITSVVCAVLFADLPYHLLRGEVHLLLASYTSIPVATYMIVKILDDRPLWVVDLRPLRWRSLFSKRNAFMAVLCIAVGSLGVYYAVFTMIIVGPAGIAAAAKYRSWRPLAHAAAIVALIGGTSFLNDIPAVIFTQHHGRNAVVAQRLPQESEIYALKFAQMVLPVPGDRIGALSRLRYEYDSTTPVASEGAQQALGMVGDVGLVWMLIIAVGAIVGMDRTAPWLRRQRQLAFATMVAFLIGTLGGISAVVAYLITSQIRAWDRISIFIAFFSLATVGLGLDAIGRRFFSKRRWPAVVGLGAILLFGIFEQSTRIAIPAYQATGVSYGSDTLFVHAIERIMPGNAAIFQLPYMAFPEQPPINAMQDYDPLRGYLHETANLRWSYPSMEGRPDDWGSQTQALPVPTLIDGVVAAGFSGLWIDRYGYSDMGAAIIPEVQSLTGSAPLNSRDGRFAFFDLRAYAARMRAHDSAVALAALRTAILYPAVVTWGNGFYAPEPDGSRWAIQGADATANNLSGTARRVELYTDVHTLAKGHFKLVIRAPGGAVGHFTITTKPRPIYFSFTLPPGAHDVNFATNAPITLAPGDPRNLVVHYGTPVLSYSAFTPFLPGRADYRP